MDVRSILLPTDFSDCARHAVPVAAEFARLLGARVICLHVVEAVVQPVGWTPLAEPLPAAEIVRVAEERSAGLIVISSQGRRGLGRILFGSTAESVVRHARCPVLVVKPPKESDED